MTRATLYLSLSAILATLFLCAHLKRNFSGSGDAVFKATLRRSANRAQDEASGKR